METTNPLSKAIYNALCELAPDYKEAYELSENLKIANLTAIIERDRCLIDFSFNFREDGNDAWLQCEYYSQKLKKKIIFDYYVCQVYGSNVENGASKNLLALIDLAETLAYYEMEINLFERGISFKSFI